MKIQTLTRLAAAASLAALAGCGGMHHSTLGAGPAPAVAATAAKLNAADLAFANTAAGSGMYEVEISRIATTKARSGQVKNYGQMLVQHHTMANDELIALMRSRGATPPASIPADLQAKMAQINGQSGDAFDQAYIRIAGVQDHQANIALFEQASRTVSDPALKAWVDKTLPTLRQHLQAAQTIAGTLAG